MMPRQVNKSWICVALALSVLLILAGSRYNITDNISYRVSFETNRSLLHNVNNRTTEDRVEWSLPLPMNLYDGSPNIELILDSTRSQIKFELRNYNFTYSGVKKLDDLLMESGGRPVRSIIISTWRSGSSFLGEVLNAMPDTFYHYEPLFSYKSEQIRSPPHADSAISTLMSILKCDYHSVKEYFDTENSTHKAYLHFLKHNTRLWNTCSNSVELCSAVTFTTKFCKLFPFQSMKVVHMRLRLIKAILHDKELNAKVVLLIRDPRGVMQSRRNINQFCYGDAHCLNPMLLCADMTRGYFAAGRLLKMYPDRLMILRFEELAFNLKKTTVQLFKFLRLGVMPSVEEFLQMHTNQSDSTLPYSTYRVSRDVPFKWKSTLVFDYVEELQGVCSNAMELWGYNMAHNATHMANKDFYPLKSYTLV